MMKLAISLLLVLLQMAVAGPASSHTKHYDCKTFDVPITVTDIPTIVLPFLPVKDQYQATSVLNALTSRTQPQTIPQLVNVSGTYNIATQFCSPAGQRAPTTLQILTHGLGFNASYWDFYLPSNQNDAQYSYIAAATAAGYSTLSYNRLGISGSTLADPDKEVQTTVELAILAQITQLAREGKLQGTKPAKILHVGHSYGSVLSNALAAVKPSLSDGLVLTGYNHAMAGNPLFAANTNFLIASLADPSRFPPSQYPTGYVTWPSQWSNQYSFFAYPEFDPAVLAQAEATKQPLQIAELASAPLLTLNAPSFKGPVLYVNAEKDLIFCASNCTGLVEEGGLDFQAFNGTTVESVIIAGAGHGLNLHYTAQETYGKIIDWVKRHGF